MALKDKTKILQKKSSFLCFPQRLIKPQAFPASESLVKKDEMEVSSYWRDSLQQPEAQQGKQHCFSYKLWWSTFHLLKVIIRSRGMA